MNGGGTFFFLSLSVMISSVKYVCISMHLVLAFQMVTSPVQAQFVEVKLQMHLICPYDNHNKMERTILRKVKINR